VGGAYRLLKYVHADIATAAISAETAVSERKLENFFKFKAGKNFNRRNTWRILRIKI